MIGVWSEPEISNLNPHDSFFLNLNLDSYFLVPDLDSHMTGLQAVFNFILAICRSCYKL